MASNAEALFQEAEGIQNNNDVIITLIIFKKKIKGLLGGLGVEAALAAANAKQAGGGRRGRALGHGREGGWDGPTTDSGPGPGPPPHSLALLAVIEHDGVVVAARDDRLAVGAEVEAVNLVRVLAEHLGDAETPQHAVGQLHGGGCWRRRRRRRRAGAGPGGERAGGRAGCRGADPGGAGAAPAASAKAADSRATSSPSSSCTCDALLPGLRGLADRSSSQSPQSQPARRRLIVSAILGRQAEAEGEEPHRGARRERGRGGTAARGGAARR